MRKNVKLRSFNSSENIQKKEYWPERPVLNNKFSSVTMNDLAMKARVSCFNKTVIPKTDINPNKIQIE